MKKVLVFCLLTVFSAFYLSCYAGTWTSGNTTVTTSGSTITVSPKSGTNGAMADYDDEFYPEWVSTSYTSIVIEEGVTHIGAYAFIYAHSEITSITVATSVTSIGAGAFASNLKIANIYFAGSPNEWASITFANDASNPFGDSDATNRRFYFYGSNTATTVLTLTPGITEVKAYAFYNANKFTDINIPGSVSHIGSYAFRCSVSGTVCVNRATPPITAGKNTITYGNSAKLYVPSGSKSAYVAAGMPWKYDTGTYGLTSANIIEQAVNGNTLGTYGSNVTWALGEDGVLTLDASSPSADKNITIDAASTSKMPWYYFRRLVYKIKIKGEVTGLNNLLHYHYGIAELIMDQQNIPSISATYIATSGSTPYSSLFNPRDILTLRVKLSSILSPTQADKLETAPWNDGKWQIAISDEVIINESEDNSEVLSSIQEKVDVPFTMQFTRSLTNASYNTFCSPVPLTAAQLGGADIRALESTTYDDGSEELYLNFSSTPLSAVEAGVPYLIKPSSTISNPTFTDVDPGSVVVDPETVETSEVDFHGVLKPTTLTGGDKSILFLGAGNELFWPATTGDIKGLRAYFEIKEGSGARRAIRARMNMDGHSTPMSIKNVQENDVQGTKILRDGKLYLMYDGRMYDVQGRLVD